MDSVVPSEATQAEVFLQGDRIVLRNLQLADADGPYPSWMNDPEVCQYNSHHVYPYTPEKARQYIESVRATSNAVVLAVVIKETGEHIGNISLQGIHPVHRSAEFAILMGDKAHWGNAYGKEAGILLCRHGFNALNLHRIYCGTHEHNVGMQKLALYLGMQEEGRLRQAQFKQGQYVDNLLYGVLRDEFFALHSN